MNADPHIFIWMQFRCKYTHNNEFIYYYEKKYMVTKKNEYISKFSIKSKYLLLLPENLGMYINVISKTQKLSNIFFKSISCVLEHNLNLILNGLCDPLSTIKYYRSDGSRDFRWNNVLENIWPKFRSVPQNQLLRFVHLNIDKT